MDDKLIIDASRVDPEGEEIEGEVECIDLDEEFVKPFGGVRYRLNLQVFGTELLVRGHLEQDFDLVCCRCGKTYFGAPPMCSFCQKDQRLEEEHLRRKLNRAYQLGKVM